MSEDFLLWCVVCKEVSERELLLLNQRHPDSFLEVAWRWNVQVARLRLLGDYHHSTRIAFVEFVMVCAFSLICRQLLTRLKGNQYPEFCALAGCLFYMHLNSAKFTVHYSNTNVYVLSHVML